MDTNEEVVITAFGAVTPLGNNYESISHSLYHGISGIKEIKKFPTEFYSTRHAGIPEEGNCRNHYFNKTNGELFYTDLAAKKLVEHEQFPIQYYQPDKIGCVIGVDEPAVNLDLCFDLREGGIEKIEQKDLLDRMTKHFRLSDFMNLAPSAVLSAIHKYIHFSGFATTHLGLCSASLQAIGLGYKILKNNQLDAVVVGGVSGKVNPLNLARLELMDVVSTDQKLPPCERSRPYDEKRSGFVLAEGSILFLLEKRINAEKRGVKPLLTVSGYGSSMAAQHIVAPHIGSKEMLLAMERALIDANQTENDIDLVNSHGTSTVLNDLHEAKAINSIFKSNRDVMVTANKSLHGHLIAASGAMEVLNTLISVNEGFIPGVINLEKQDKNCSINVVSKSLDIATTNILKNSFGMGGLAASMVLKRVEL